MQRRHPISTISKALGHHSEKTTQIYLASLDISAVDDANNDILSGLITENAKQQEIEVYETLFKRFYFYN